MARKAVERDRAYTMQMRVGAFEVRKRGASRYDLRDPYYLALAVGWPAFLATLFALEIGITAVFAALYLARPGSIANAKPGSFADAFFFSIETLATVGYGAMSPATLYGHTIATLEIFCGMAFVALATGLTFVRFSRPRPKFLYAENPVVAPMNGRMMLMIRIANGRLGPLTDAHATLGVMLAEHTTEGQSFRRAYDLMLVRPHLPVFALTWTLMHDLGPGSPLHGFDARRLAAQDARIILTIAARDPALAAEVYDTRDYLPSSILFGMRYADALITDAQGRSLADLSRISEVENETAMKPDPA